MKTKYVLLIMVAGVCVVLWGASLYFDLSLGEIAAVIGDEMNKSFNMYY